MSQANNSKAQQQSASEAVGVEQAAVTFTNTAAANSAQGNTYNSVIPFNRLRLSAANVRRSGRDTANYRSGIEALAASILSTHQQTGQGLLQNLVVHTNGEFFDVAEAGVREAGM